MNRAPPAAVAAPVSTKDRVEMASPRVDLHFETTAAPVVLNRKRPTVLSHQQLMHFLPHPYAQATPCNCIEQEVETTLCSPDNKTIPRLQVKVPSHQERKRTFAHAGTQQGMFEQIKSAALSRSRLGPYSFPPSSKYVFKMEQYRALQRSENFTTSATEGEVASHASPTASQVLSATKPVTVSSPRKSKSPLGFYAVNVENIYPVMKQSETCKQVDEDALTKTLLSAADQKQEFPRNNRSEREQFLTETKIKLGFSKTKVTCVGSQSKLEQLKKLIFGKKDTIDIKSVAKKTTKPDEKSVLVNLVQSLDTQEEIKPDANEWKVFFSNESDRVKVLADVGKQTSPKPSAGEKTGVRKSGIPPPRAIGVRKGRSDQICPAQQDKIPGQIDDRKEHVKSSQKPRTEQTSDMGRKTPNENSQSPSSPGAEQSRCSRCEHKHSEKRMVKRRCLPLPSNVTSLRLYGPVFCRLHKQKARRDAAKKAKYQPKLATIPEGPDEIDPEYDGNKIAEWLREEMKKISRFSSASSHSQYNWPD